MTLFPAAANSMRIAVLDDFQNVARDMADWSRLPAGNDVTFFHDHLADPGALRERLTEFQIVVAMRERTPFPAALIDALPKLKLLITTGMRNASFDLDAAARAGVLVCGTDGVGSPPAELTWGLILALARHIPGEHAGMRAGRWQTTVGTMLEGKTLGLLGLGRLGAIAARVGAAFGMELIAWSQNLTAEKAQESGATLVEQDELFARSDFLCIHLVLSERTRGLVGARELGLMKPAAYLVNISRGPIVDEAALVSALKKKQIAGAGLDVFDVEPLPAKHALRRLDNVVLTPHLGYVTAEGYRKQYAGALEDILAFLDGKPVRALNAPRSIGER